MAVPCSTEVPAAGLVRVTEPAGNRIRILLRGVRIESLVVERLQGSAWALPVTSGILVMPEDMYSSTLLPLESD
jgi:hypothetical protein